MISYYYSIQSGTLNHKVATDSLTVQIQNSTIITALDHIDTSGDLMTVYFKTSLSDGDWSTLSGVVSGHPGISLTPSPINVQPLTQAVSPLWMSSHDMCDPCTWWQESIRVISGSPSSNTGNTIHVGHVNVVDMEHGRAYGEDDVAGTVYSIVPLAGTAFGGNNDLIFKLWVNGTLKTRVDTAPSSGQYQITSYESGIILTGEDWSANTVTMSYHYASGSGYKYAPSAGKLFRIGLTEANMQNADMNTAILYFSVFAAGKEQARRIYKNESDYIAASIGSPQTYKDWVTMQWDYKRAENEGYDSRITVKSSQSAYVYMRTVNDAPIQKLDSSGNPASVIVTLYCTSEPDST